VCRVIEVLETIGVSCRWGEDGELELVRPATLDLDGLDAAAARMTRSVVLVLGPFRANRRQAPSNAGWRTLISVRSVVALLLIGASAIRDGPAFARRPLLRGDHSDPQRGSTNVRKQHRGSDDHHGGADPEQGPHDRSSPSSTMIGLGRVVP